VKLPLDKKTTGRLGVYWYLGKTQSGKTTRAFAELCEDAEITGWPCLVLDPMRAENFAKYKHAESLAAAIKRLVGEELHTFYTPGDYVEEFSRLMRAIREVGYVHVLVDECSFFMSWRSCTPEISAALRGWYHSKVTYRLTTQRPGDIHGDVYACDPEVKAFRTEKEGDLKRLKDEFNFDPERLKALPQGSFELKKRGF